MNQLFVYIDEAGDLGFSPSSSKYLIITSLMTPDIAELDRIIKNARRGKFRKLLKSAQELHATSSPGQLKEYILKKIVDSSAIECQSIILEKNVLFSDYLKKNKHRLYNYVCGHLVNMWTLTSKDLIIRFDRCKQKESLREDIDRYVKQICMTKMWNCHLEMHHSWSHSWSGLQLCDFVSWAVFRKFEHGDEKYFNIIEKKVNISRVWKKM